MIKSHVRHSFQLIPDAGTDVYGRCATPEEICLEIGQFALARSRMANINGSRHDKPEGLRWQGAARGVWL